MRFNIFYVLGLFLVLACGDDTPRRPLNKNKTSQIAYSIKINTILNQLETKEIEAYIKNNPKETYEVSEHGFYYANLKQAKQKSSILKKGDKVRYTFQVSDIKGKVLYAFKEVGELNYLVDKEPIIKGLQIGIKFMKENDEFKFLFPSFVAFGYEGDGDLILPNQPIVFHVKLLKINK